MEYTLKFKTYLFQTSYTKTYFKMFCMYNLLGFIHYIFLFKCAICSHVLDNKTFFFSSYVTCEYIILYMEGNIFFHLYTVKPKIIQTPEFCIFLLMGAGHYS